MQYDKTKMFKKRMINDYNNNDDDNNKAID